MIITKKQNKKNKRHGNLNVEQTRNLLGKTKNIAGDHRNVFCLLFPNEVFDLY